MRMIYRTTVLRRLPVGSSQIWAEDANLARSGQMRLDECPPSGGANGVSPLMRQRCLHRRGKRHLVPLKILADLEGTIDETIETVGHLSSPMTLAL